MQVLAELVALWPVVESGKMATADGDASEARGGDRVARRLALSLPSSSPRGAETGQCSAREYNNEHRRRDALENKARPAPPRPKPAHFDLPIRRHLRMREDQWPHMREATREREKRND